MGPRALTLGPAARTRSSMREVMSGVRGSDLMRGGCWSCGAVVMLADAWVVVSFLGFSSPESESSVMIMVFGSERNAVDEELG